MLIVIIYKNRIQIINAKMDLLLALNPINSSKMLLYLDRIIEVDIRT